MDRFSKTPSDSRYGCGFQIGAPARYFLPFTVLKPAFAPDNNILIFGTRALLLTVYGFETVKHETIDVRERVVPRVTSYRLRF